MHHVFALKWRPSRTFARGGKSDWIFLRARMRPDASIACFSTLNHRGYDFHSSTHIALRAPAVRRQQGDATPTVALRQTCGPLVRRAHLTGFAVDPPAALPTNSPDTHSYSCLLRNSGRRASVILDIAEWIIGRATVLTATVWRT